MRDLMSRVSCPGCGQCLFSFYDYLEHPEEQSLQPPHYCEACSEALSRGMRSSAMVNHRWTLALLKLEHEFIRMKGLSVMESCKLGVFGWRTRQLPTHELSCKKGRPPHKITDAEWVTIAEEKLNAYKHLCSADEFKQLNELIHLA